MANPGTGTHVRVAPQTIPQSYCGRPPTLRTPFMYIYTHITPLFSHALFLARKSFKAHHGLSLTLLHFVHLPTLTNQTVEHLCRVDRRVHVIQLAIVAGAVQLIPLHHHCRVSVCFITDQFSKCKSLKFPHDRA